MLGFLFILIAKICGALTVPWPWVIIVLCCIVLFDD